MICSLIFGVVFNGDDDVHSCVCVFGRLGEYRGVSLRAWVLFRGNYIWESLVLFLDCAVLDCERRFGSECGVCAEDDEFDLDFRMEQVCMVGCWLGCFFELVLGR